jgi:uncharacterized membrane protein
MNKAMPVLGGITILLTIAAAVLGRDDRDRVALLVGATVCLVAAGLVTRFLNQPINAIVIAWRTESPPENWTVLRDQWWRWHMVRLLAGLGGLCLLIAAALRRGCLGG